MVGSAPTDICSSQHIEIIKGFAAQTTTKVLESVQAMGSQYNPLIEDDQVVSAFGSS